MTLVLLPGWLDPPELTGVEYAFFDTGAAVPPQDLLDRVECFVPPYMCDLGTVALAARMPSLRLVQALMAGVEGWREVVPTGVEVRRAQGLHDASTAELAVGLVIAAQRGIDVAARDQREHAWRHERRRALADSSVGIVGWGGVGRAIAARMAPFEVAVTAFSRSGRDGARPVAELDQALPGLDVVVLALPLTDETAAFMDARRLARMAPGALLVNVGRGGLVDTDALVSAVRADAVRAALDVTDPEPLPPDHPLWTCPNVLITPHVGGDSAAFPPRARRMVAGMLRDLAAGQDPGRSSR